MLPAAGKDWPTVWVELSAEFVDAVATDGVRLAHVGYKDPDFQPPEPEVISLRSEQVPVLLGFLRQAEERRVTLTTDNEAFLGWINGNLRLMILPDRIWWQSFTRAPGGWLQNQRDGNIVLMAPPSAGAPQARQVWSTNTAGNPGTRLVIENDGNLEELEKQVRTVLQKIQAT